MRFSRFKQQMEGVPPSPRKPRSTVAHQKKPKREKAKPKREMEPKKDNKLLIKPEPREDMEQKLEESIIHPEAFVKDEPVEEEYDPHVGSMEWMESRQHPREDFLSPYQENEAHFPSPDPLQVKEEPKVKLEPDWAI